MLYSAFTGSTDKCRQQCTLTSRQCSDEQYAGPFRQYVQLSKLGAEQTTHMCTGGAVGSERVSSVNVDCITAAWAIRGVRCTKRAYAVALIFICPPAVT